MKTKPIDNKNSKDGGNGKWTRAKIAAALAAGAITDEAANILYDQLIEDSNRNSESTSVASQEEQNTLQEDEMPVESDIQPLPEFTTETEPQPEPEPEAEPENEQELEPTQDPEPQQEHETTPENESNQEPEPTPEPEVDEDDIVDVIVEEIDPHDIDMEDILLIDDIGTVYTVDGRELNAALIHDAMGNQAMIVDIDGDNVYDVITTPEGEIIDGIPGDIDVSDIELLYAQQHGETGYMEQNDFDTAMNDDNVDMQNDISLT